MKSEGIKFSIISNRISDYRLKPRDYAVYCCLVKHSDKNGVCFPSRRLIAEEC
ncbi:MAG: helix-turn-helix domain-containing protein [Ruminococcus sp.]|uniref:helix-turn-helix domain-containing protein n=1 Tax=Ruminococcoides intestinihominis TaxID=3133161 RepID=UPI001B3CA43C